MGDERSNVTAAMTIRVPQDLGWAVQRGDQNWQGNEIGGFVERLTRTEPGTPVTLSVSLIFELTSDGTPLMSDDE